LADQGRELSRLDGESPWRQRITIEFLAGGSMGQKIRVVQLVKAQRADLWRAVATPSGLARWQADRADGSIRKGATVRLSWPALHAEVNLEVAAVRNGASITYRNGDTRTRFDVEDGSVTLEHDGLDEDDDLEGFASSWRVALAALKHSTEHFPGRTRTVEWFTRTVNATPEIAHLYFTDPTALAAWLGRSSGVGNLGSPYSIVGDSGMLLEGRVLARVPARDVALSWDSADAAITLRTLPSRGAKDRGVAGGLFFWGAPRPVGPGGGAGGGGAAPPSRPRPAG
jgi:uncharacterized protein YndB with AHSA1/START domain